MESDSIHEEHEALLKYYEERVLKTDKDDCWGWSGSTYDLGHGCINYKSKRVRAHRFAYAHFVGEIPKGMNVKHSCDNLICTNPKHLFLSATRNRN